MTLNQSSEEKFQMNSNSIDQDLIYLKEWLKKEPHLPDDFDDHRIHIFLKGCKFSLEKCKRKLDMYFTMRSVVPEFFTNRDISRPELQEINKIMQMPLLPILTPDRCRVIVMRGVEKDIQPPNVTNAFKVALMFADLRLRDETEDISGNIFILDAATATINHFVGFTPALVKKFLSCIKEAYPVKLKQIHILNMSPIVERIVNFVMPFLKEKMRKRVFIHRNIKDLYNHIPQDLLPTEYGGKIGFMNDINSEWLNHVAKFKNWFKEQDKFKSNESCRPGKPKNHNELFGFEGSFRQLDID